jgi:hypothetical protein
LHIVDVAVPTDPRELATLALDGTPLAVAAAGTYAYVALQGTPDRLKVIDASNPFAPREVGSLDLGRDRGYPLRLAAVDRYVYVLDGSWLAVVDAGDPAHPRTLGSALLAGGAQDLAAAGQFALVAAVGRSAADGGLRIFDLGDPAAPREVGAFAPLSSDGWARAAKVAAAGGRAYVTAFDSSLRVVDLSDPSAPRQLGSGALPDFTATDVAAAGGYVATSASGSTFNLELFGVANPSCPTLAGSLRVPGSPYALAMSTTNVYVAAGEAGLAVLRIVASREDRCRRLLPLVPRNG